MAASTSDMNTWLEGDWLQHGTEALADTEALAVAEFEQQMDGDA